DDVRIVAFARARLDLEGRVVHALRRAVELRRGHRLEAAAHRHHATRPGNRLALQALRVAAAVPVFVVGERELARELEQRVVVFADDLRAERRVALDALPIGCRELRVLAQDLRRHAELADVVDRRRDLHHLADLRPGARSLRQKLRVLTDAYHAVADRGALVQLQGPPQPLDQLAARALELLGALLHQALELRAPVNEREMHLYARLEDLGVDRLGDVVDGAELEALDLRL